MQPSTDSVFIFPLNTVLFPGGVLPLKIFEQRYIEMTKVCLRDSVPFGVCLIKEGREVGTPAVPQQIGCLARIAEWEMPQLGVFQLSVVGTERFCLVESTVGKYGLISATIEKLPVEPDATPVDELCAQVLKAIMDKVGAEHFPAPHRLDDAAWVSYRLSEVLPLNLDTRQEILQLPDPEARQARLRQILSEQGAAG